MFVLQDRLLERVADHWASTGRTTATAKTSQRSLTLTGHYQLLGSTY